MRHKLLILFTFTAIALFLLSTRAFGDITPEVTVKFNKKVLSQGDTLFIDLKSTQKLDNPVIIFNNQHIKMFSSDHLHYKAMIGIEAIQRPGVYILLLADPTSKIKEEHPFKITNARYPVQNIKITGEKSTLSASDYELEKINKAKALITPTAFFSSAPYISPAKGCISSIYGVSRYHNGKMTGDYHKGVDIRANKGQPIRSITGGKVLIAEQFKLHGGTVMVDHGQGLSSIYIHMSKINVKAGDSIKSGQVIGEIGSTGFATGPHLHWGLYVNGVPVDPTKFWIKPVDKCL